MSDAILAPHLDHPLKVRLATLSAIAVVLLLSPAFADADRVGFEKVMVPFFKSYCLDCHDRQTQEGLLSLEDISHDVISDDFETWRMIQEQLQFGEMPPQDAEQPAADEKKAALAWLEKEVLKSQLPGAITLEKLTLPQFGNYVDHRALFGQRSTHVMPAPPRLWRVRPEIYAAVMPRADGLANGLNMVDGAEFKDYSSSYFLDEAATAPLISNAKKMANALIGPKSKERGLVKLASDGTDDVRPHISRTFQMVLGRQATAEELERFAEFYQRSQAKAGNQAAARVLVTAILMQPEALFRQELGEGTADEFGRVRLSPREIVFALSFALANKPVAEFATAARSGELASRQSVADAVRRHLSEAQPSYGNGGRYTFENSPRLVRFFAEYFDYLNVNEVFKDPPEGVGSHEPSRLAGDLELTILDVLIEDKDVLARLLTTNHYYVHTKRVSDRERGIYLAHSADQKRSSYHTAFNLPIDWQWNAEKQPVEFRDDERAGVLTHPAWLVAWSGNFENHPVQRGKWIRTHLLGGTVPDVPIGVDARVPEKEHTTFRNRLKLATSAAECWRCHRKMDPLGVAFERYDHYGRYQRLDAGQPVDASSKIDRTGVASLDGQTFDNPAEMMRFLARSEHVEQVFVRHAFRFFLGRNETIGDANTLQDAHKAYRDSGGSFKELVVSLLSSDSFLYRKAPQP